MKDELTVSSSKMLPSRNVKHPLHLAVADTIERRGIGPAVLYRDEACGGSPRQRLPLFLGKRRSSCTRLCNVDLLVIKEDAIKVVIEIEESASKPTTICGKFLTSVLATHFIHDSLNAEPIQVSDSALFVQVINTSKLPKGTNKLCQYELLESELKKLLRTLTKHVKKYKLFRVAGENDVDALREVANAVALACNA